MLLIEIGTIFAVFGGLIFRLFPPKNINHIYGYRSRFSMKAQSIWKEGQRYCADTFILIGVIIFVLGVLEYLLFNSIHATKIIENTIEGIEILLSILVMYIRCETHLKNMFNEDGSIKNADGS